MLRDEEDAGDQRIARRLLADTRNRGLILEHVKFFYLESINRPSLRVTATLKLGGCGRAVTDIFARIDAARFGCGQVERDRKTVVEGKSVSERVDLGGQRIIKK